MENQATVESVIKGKTAELLIAVGKRDVEIARLNSVTPSKGTTAYEPVDAPGTAGHKDAMAFIAKMNDPDVKVTKKAIDARIEKKLIRKVTIGKTNRDVYDSLTKDVKDILKEIGEKALSTKPKSGGGRTSTGNGEHKITRAWFDKHSKELPPAMKVGWDAVAGKITYEYPPGSKKTGRGGTVSHGALNNIVVAFGGKKKA
jgi:hypothetical protein